MSCFHILLNYLNICEPFLFLTKHSWRLSYALLILVCWNGFYILITCGKVFFSLLKCDLPCDWFTRTISQIMVHFRPLMHHLFCLRAFLNTVQVCPPPFCHTHDIQLINNGQAANNRIPELQHFRIDYRLMTQCCMHAITGKNMPASKTFNIQFLSVQQQKGVYRFPVFPRGEMSNSGWKEWWLDFKTCHHHATGRRWRQFSHLQPSLSLDAVLVTTVWNWRCPSDHSFTLHFTPIVCLTLSGDSDQDIDTDTSRHSFYI